MNKKIIRNVDLVGLFVQQFKISHARITKGFEEAAKMRYDGESLPIYFSRFSPFRAMLGIVLIGAISALLSGLLYRYCPLLRTVAHTAALFIAPVMQTCTVVVLLLTINSTRHQRCESKWQRIVEDMYERCSENRPSISDLKRGLKIRIYSLEQTLSFWISAVGVLVVYVNMESAIFREEPSSILEILKYFEVPGSYLHPTFAYIFLVLLAALFIFAYCPLCWHRDIGAVMDQLPEPEEAV